jgi:hypothetical protein
VPQISTPAAVAFTSQLVALRFETINCEVEAVPDTARLVVVAFVVVVLRKVFPEVNTFSVYVFGIVHGMLHLKGHDHGSTMEREETKFLRIFKWHKKSPSALTSGPIKSKRS